jgi:hypothetical protein
MFPRVGTNRWFRGLIASIIRAIHLWNVDQFHLDCTVQRPRGQSSSHFTHMRTWNLNMFMSRARDASKIMYKYAAINFNWSSEAVLIEPQQRINLKFLLFSVFFIFFYMTETVLWTCAARSGCLLMLCWCPLLLDWWLCSPLPMFSNYSTYHARCAWQWEGIVRH